MQHKLIQAQHNQKRVSLRGSYPTGALCGRFSPRIGWMSFTNTFPLFSGSATLSPGLAQHCMDVPTALNAALDNGTLDLSLVSTAAYLRRTSQWAVLPHMGIASSGPVNSVLWVRAKTFSPQKHTVMLPASSASSSALLRLLLDEELETRPEYATYSPRLWKEALSTQHNALLIGDIALRFYEHQHTGHLDYQAFEVLDLASAWHDLTGHPFIFGVWCTPQPYLHCFSDELEAYLLSLQANTQRNLDEMPRLIQAFRQHRHYSCLDFSDETLKTYWGENIRYQFTPRHLAALDVMHSLLTPFSLS